MGRAVKAYAPTDGPDQVQTRVQTRVRNRVETRRTHPNPEAVEEEGPAQNDHTRAAQTDACKGGQRPNLLALQPGNGSQPFNDLFGIQHHKLA